MVMGITQVVIKVTILILCCIQHVESLCEVETGDVVIILDIAESRNNQTDQSTYPSILPIIGNRSSIVLEIIADSENIFQLDNKQLKLKRPLDRDAKDISFIQVQIRCTVISSNAKRTIPVTVRVIDINDNVPQFLDLPYETSISELSPVGTTVFRDLRAADDDSSVNALVEYFIRPGNGSEVDGYEVFSIDLPHQGVVTLKQSVDYEKVNIYEVIIVAVDRAASGNQRLSSTATLTIHVIDADDQDPAFVFEGCSLVGGSCVNPEYITNVISGQMSGILKLNPDGIKAEDQDKINSSIIYSFSTGTPSNYADYFKIDPDSGMIRQIKSVDRMLVKNFSIIVKAEEVSKNQRFATAKLSIFVRTTDANPPILNASSLNGFVDVLAEPGSRVISDKFGKNGLHFTIYDPDLMSDDPKPNYYYELTTDKFRVNSDGYLVVQEVLNKTSTIPDKYTFQVLAREMEKKVATVPLTITVNLNRHDPDVDSLSAATVPPSYLKVVPTRSTPQTVPLYRNSNNNRETFSGNEPSTVVKINRPIVAGHNNNMTLQTDDQRDRIRHPIFDSFLTPVERPVRPPFFRQIYDIKVSEGVAPGSVVINFQESAVQSNSHIKYSIVEGNINGAFMLSPVSGSLTVRKPLDRESISHYSLVVKATERFGRTTNATVNIEITDINDCNPEFVGQPYIFHTDEGLINAVVGRVKAVDNDSDSNGVVHYLMPLNSPFRVDFFTGEIRTKWPLDYEKQQIDYAIITAKDGGFHPRIATATVTVMINDFPDEPPVFPQKHYDASVPENMANMDILQVSAVDPDGYKQITYVIRDGPYNRFSVDPASGVVRTLWSLDYEEQSFYMLVIGTRENYGDASNATCVVRITVLDRNDNPPTFTSVPQPITIHDTLQLGTSIGTVIAIDSDGMTPNNIVKYSLDSSDGRRQNYQNYFEIDHNTGVISLKGDLSREPVTEYKLEVKAYDLGNPQLTSSTIIQVYVDHSMSISSSLRLLPTFPDASYTVEIEENTLGNTPVKTLPIVNKPSLDLLSCDIKRGNDLGHFYIVTTKNGECELRTNGQKLDYETKPYHKLIVTLITNSTYLDLSRAIAEVIVNVKDTNDNPPVFQFSPSLSKIIGKRYVASIPRDAPALTTVAEVTATDNDSGSFGTVEYIIMPDSYLQHFFMVDHSTGVVSSSRTFEKLDFNVSTCMLKVMAQDNPFSNNRLNSSSILAVNLISEDTRLILIILDFTPEKVAESKKRLIEIMQDHSKLMINIEKIESRKFLNKSSSILNDPSSTDVWFHAIDPETLKIINVNDDRLNKFISNKLHQQSLLYILSSVMEMNVHAVRLPFVMHTQTVVPVLPPAKIHSEEEMDGFQAALIALACIIAVFGTVGIIYISFIWSRFAAYNNRLKKLSLAPRYEPVLVEPNLKPYETQVLQMNVHLDDSSSLEDSLPYRFKSTLDSVSYITRDTGDGSTLVMGNMSFTESDSFEGGESISLSSPRHFGPERMALRRNMSPANNPVYHSSDENGGSPIEEFPKSPQPLSGHINLSPVATTTEI